MISVSFYLHSPKKNVTPIYVLVSPGKIRASTGISIEPKYWAVKTAKKNGRAVRGKAVQVKRWIKPEYSWSEVLNKRLQEMYNRVWAAYDAANAAGEDMVLLDLPGLLDPKRKRVAKQIAERLTLQEIWEDWAKVYKAGKMKGHEQDKELERKVDHFIQTNKSAVSWMERFRPGILATDIDEGIITGLKSYILQEGKGRGGKGTQDSSVIKHLKSLRRLLAFKKLDTSFYTTGKAGKSTTHNLYWDEVLLLKNARYSEERMRRAALSFVANCQLGMRFEDMDRSRGGHFLHMRSLRHGEVRVVNLNQGKTGDPIFIPAPKIATGILQEFGWEFPMPDSADYLTRLKDFNDDLKDAGREAGLNRTVRVTNVRNNHVTEDFVPLHTVLSSHMARHTGKSRVLEATKDPLLADLLLGHSQGDTYTHHNTAQIIDDLLDAWGKIEGGK